MITNKECEERFHVLLPALTKAGDALRQFQASKNYQVQKKSDGSSVTTVDLEMSDFWLNLLSAFFPGEILVSEEDHSTHKYAPQSDAIWFVDPIDGTSKFIDGSPNYFVLISFCYHGKSVFGIMFQPECNQIFYGNTHIAAQIRKPNGSMQKIPSGNNWHSGLPLVVKGMDPDQRHNLSCYAERTVKRTSSSIHHITGPLLSPVSGFISFRSTAYWDLAAPSAIMHSAGYRTGIINNQREASYNDGTIRSDRFFCLPQDTPEHIINFIFSH